MLTKEQIIEVCKKNSFVAATFGYSVMVIPEDEFSTIAEQILSELQPDNDTPPQLHKHDVIRWQAFSSEQPIYGTDVIVYNPQTKHEMIIRWSRAVENLVDKGYKCWYEKPAIV